MQANTLYKRTMAECNLDPPSDKLCKYTYVGWCPTCNRDSPRRRTKSETHETCRKKAREMKTFTPKKFDRRHCEFENCERQLEGELPELRYERGAHRANLCELPTTYITNNCQMYLTHAKLAAASDYLDAKHSRAGDYGGGGGGGGGGGYLLNGSPPTVSQVGERIAKRCAQLPLLHKRPVGAGGGGGVNVVGGPGHHYAVGATPYTAALRASPTRNLTMATASPPGMAARDGTPLAAHARPPMPDTCTFFDMNFDAKTVRERYARELDVLREKLKVLHQHKYRTMGPPARIKNLDKLSARRQTTNVALEDIRIIEDVSEPKIDGAAAKYGPTTLDGRQRVARSRDQKSSTKVSIKVPKTRFTNGRVPKIKLRPFKANPVLMDDDSTTESEADDASNAKKVALKDSPDGPELEAPAAVSASPVIDATVSGDAPMWPVRHSLFPHIPPYLQFSMHDSPANKLPPGRRYMKWKLSTITPIIVRKTLLNTGFRLVRNDDEPEADPHAKCQKLYIDNMRHMNLVRNYYNMQCPMRPAFAESNDWTGTWGKHMKSPMFKTLKDNQKLNHFAGTFQLGRKDRLWKNVQRLMHRFGSKEFGFIPQTFILPHDLKSLKQCWECKDGSAGEKWIIKPPASARGVGIKVINKWSQLPKQSSIVVQKYIADPYLINGSKFDLRLYVLVTSFNPLRIYLYPEGLVRFASVKYSDNDKDLKDRFMHLTNYSINKLSSQYTANEDANSCQGHKWTLTKLWEYLSDRGVNTTYLWDALRDLVIKTMLSGESPISQLCSENIMNRYNCYELFGVDVLFDERLKPWLLEVNISPSLHSSSPLDLHVKGPLVQTLFNLAQFHLPPKVSRCAEVSPPCYDPRLYTTALTPMEVSKHNYYTQIEARADYLDDILHDLTGDDVRFLTQAEDELVVQGDFERIFPTAETYKFLEYIPIRYYNRLFDAWETQYHNRRDEGINLLRELCTKRIHLKVQPQPVTAKSSPNTTPGITPNSMKTDDKLLPEPETPNVQKTEPVTSAQDSTN